MTRENILTIDKDEGNHIYIDFYQVKKSLLIFRALNHKLRQDILRFIKQEKGVTVTSIYSTLEVEQSVASQHLAILRRAQFVKTKRDGKFILYYINDQQFEILEKVNQILLQ
jgi:DNA-binding transcriptional ArsR family regulator